MHVFITGATGWIGSAVTGELLEHGHEVTGLARSAAAAPALEAKGAKVHRGSLEDPDSLAAGAAAAEAVIHLAFNHDFTDYDGAGRTERDAVQRMLAAMEGSGRPFLFASGLLGAEPGRLLTEDDVSPFHGPDTPRGGSENLALPYADRGVRAVALRLPIVHGAGDRGFVATLTEIAAKRGISGYIGDGETRWACAHRDDAARLIRYSLDTAEAGSRVHLVAEEGVRSRDIAAAIGAHLGVPVESVPKAEAEEHFGWLGWVFGMDVAASSTRTRERFGWQPTRPTLLEDIARGAYPAPGA